MNVFLDYLNSLIQESQEVKVLQKTFKIGDWTFKSLGDHHAGKDRAYRYPDKTESDWTEFIKNVIKRTSTMDRNIHKGDKEVAFKSRSLGMKMIMNLNFDKKEVRPITILAPDQVVKQGTGSIMVEKQQDESIETIEID